MRRLVAAQFVNMKSRQSFLWVICLAFSAARPAQPHAATPVVDFLLSPARAS